MPTSTDSRDDNEEAVRVRAWLTAVSARNSEAAQKRRALPTFPQLRKRFAFRCGLLSITIVGLLFDYYRHGIDLDTTGAFSSTMLLILAIPVLLCLAIVSASQMLRTPLGSKPNNLWILLALPAAFAIPTILNVPVFTDGAARTLRGLNLSEELVTATSEELAKPQDRYDDWGARGERWTQISKKYPFSKLGLRSPHLSILKSSLLFEFGSPIADRWGFSISGTKGQSPSIPGNCSDLRTVSKEIVVFRGPPD